MTPFSEMPSNSRIWIYQSNHAFSTAELKEISEAATSFVEGWTAHDTSLKASFQICYDRFIIFAVDEEHAGASGCSIDKSLKFIKDIEQHYKVRLLDRMTFAYKMDGLVNSCSSLEFGNLMEEGVLNDETIVFNNLVKDKKDFDCKWEVPLKDSWHKQFVG